MDHTRLSPAGYSPSVLDGDGDEDEDAAADISLCVLERINDRGFNTTEPLLSVNVRCFFGHTDAYTTGSWHGMQHKHNHTYPLPAKDDYNNTHQK